jgi:hypothetical protein
MVSVPKLNALAWRRRGLATMVVGVALGIVGAAPAQSQSVSPPCGTPDAAATAPAFPAFEARSLDGCGNNRASHLGPGG